MPDPDAMAAVQELLDSYKGHVAAIGNAWAAYHPEGGPRRALELAIREAELLGADELKAAPCGTTAMTTTARSLRARQGPLQTDRLSPTVLGGCRSTRARRCSGTGFPSSAPNLTRRVGKPS